MPDLRERPHRFARANAFRPPPTPPARPKLALRVLPRGTREASLALIEYSLPRPDRRLPEKATRFLKVLSDRGARVLHADGVDPADPPAGTHAGFMVLVEAAGTTLAELETLVTEAARDLPGDDPETV